MATHILWCAFAWTFKGLLCTCRFFWVSPYYSIKYMPNEPHRTGKDQVKQKTGSANQGIPGSHDSSAMQRRLSKAEREIQALKTQITFERATWERKFVELQVIQQDLRYQLISETVARPGSLPQVGSFEDLGESEVENRQSFDGKDQNSSSSHSNRSKGSERMSSTGDTCQSSLSGSQVSLNSAFGFRPISALSPATSGSSWRSYIGPHRVFVPHSPLDLQTGHRVRVLLPSGRISTGTVRYLGHLEGEPDFHMGVELESLEHGQQDGTHRGQCYFECKAGHGAFVPFTKLLMAWE
ncbi:centrosome-associated protein 350-like isoform X1 [Oncorhynchus kisutch]|uniref:Centrosome-associated protein 350-like n=1 Tax=Oncorhynchus kisutch TaxID=8019 RepID=A0A8C7GKP7_ONCKI|nr:centrosome-associated protein 350-like isoform X1 [Oncorhynchus kisutch]XP_031647338.1 centrosome-associated protein 350-like isoform X1 [Oncorhynchus kisutch]